MFELLLTIDDEKARAQAQIETVLETPGDHDRMTARLLHVGDSPPSFFKGLKSQLASAGFTTESICVRGDPATTILETAESHDVDRICLTSRSRTPTGKAIFGSVTQSVIASTERPVLVCHPLE
ncbi:universal stress protein [Halocatena halophila]|uniref:universal stress protein n=1 Tax=Halocatena halophila TaxID=2814576 RepID=UPI002ED03690